MNQKQRTLTICITTVVIIMIIYSYFSVYTYGKKTTLNHADVAIVLGAAAWGNTPSPVFKERINHAIDLYFSNQVDKLIFTGGKQIETDFAESEVARLYALQQGVKEEDILIETNSQVTYENLLNAKTIMELEGIKTALIVSDPYHMKRSMFFAEELEITAYPSPTPSSKYKSMETKFKFLSREAALFLGYELKSMANKVSRAF